MAGSDGMSKILDNLFLGCLDDSLNENEMAENRIAAVVRIDSHPDKIDKMESNPPRYHLVKMVDREFQELEPHNQGVNNFVHEARLNGEAALIHCVAGVSRSASLTIAYLMSMSDYGYEDAWRSVLLARSIIRPNSGFHEKLKKFEKHGLHEERCRLKAKFGSHPRYRERYRELAAADNAALANMVKRAPWRLSTLTFNAWGLAIPGFNSPNRLQRMQDIGNWLKQHGNVRDIVALQEVWNYDDFLTIQRHVQHVYPESHYFHCGRLGSGVCIFTKATITSATMHRYSWNGCPYPVQGGGWLCGKIVGLVRLKLHGLKIDVYATQLHPGYDHKDELYLPRQITQAYELSQFVRMTSTGDVAVLMGNLNMEENHVGYKLIVWNARLFDAFKTRRWEHLDSIQNDNGWTWKAPWNSYTSQADKEKSNGKRYDYIMYRANGKINVECQMCYTDMGRSAIGKTMSYSDHEAVAAIFEVKKEGEMPPFQSEDVLDEAVKEIEKGIDKLHQLSQFYIFVVALALIVHLATCGIKAPVLSRLLLQLMLTLVCSCSFLFGVTLRKEKKEMEASRVGLMLLKKTKMIP